MKYLVGITMFTVSAIFTFFLNNANILFTVLTGLAWGLGATIVTNLFLEIKKHSKESSEKKKADFDYNWSGLIISFLGWIILTTPNFYNLDLDFWHMLKFLVLGIYQLIVSIGFLYVYRYKVSKN